MAPLVQHQILHNRDINTDFIIIFITMMTHLHHPIGDINLPLVGHELEDPAVSCPVDLLVTELKSMW